MESAIDHKDFCHQYDALLVARKLLRLAHYVERKHPDTERELKKQAEILARFAADGLRLCLEVKANDA